MLKVAKFGGSSMADAGQYRKVKDIILSDPDRKVIVVSAAGKRNKDDHKITDLLYLCYSHVKYGVDPSEIFEMIADRYRGICRELGLGFDVDRELADLKASLKKGVELDWLVSRGEYFSAKMLADYIGYDFVDSTEWVRFRLDGTLDKESTYASMRAIGTHLNIVVPGFYGALPDGRIRLMSRGGSDITGALAAAALNAEVYENWTDVSGILRADPGIVENPETIRHLTYPELRALSYMGANVLHEASIIPVREKHIPLNILNTNDPSDPGTMIMEKFEENAADRNLLTGIAGRRDFTLVTIHRSGMSGESGVFCALLEPFAEAGINVEHVTTGIDSVSFAISSEVNRTSFYSVLAEIEKKLEPDGIEVNEGISLVAAVGRRMCAVPGSSGALFDSLGKHGINVRMISQEPEEVCIIVGVDNEDFDRCVRVIYDSLVKKKV